MSECLSFGPFLYDPRQRLLFRNGTSLPLGRRGVLLLEALLRRRGQVVRKADLMDAAWPEESVEESNLSVQMTQLRRLIGGSWIRTVERFGYQFVDTELTARPQKRPIVPELAVAPFSGIDDKYLASAMSEEVLTALIRFGSLRVASGSGPIGDTDYRLQGSVRATGNPPALWARLIETASESHLWSGRFNFPRRSPSVSTIASIAGRIAAMVERQIEVREGKLVQFRPLEGLTANELLRRAQPYIVGSPPADVTASLGLLERALTLEPENVACLATICRALDDRIAMGWSASDLTDRERCRQYGLRGLALPEVDSRALACFGIAIYRNGDPDHGYHILQRAAELNPNDLHTQVYAGTSSMHWGGLDKAERQYRRALTLDPYDPGRGFALGGLARINMMRGRFASALHFAEKAIAANLQYGAAHWTLIAASAQLGDHEKAALYLARFVAMQPGVTVSAIRASQPTRGRMASTLEGLEQAGLTAH